MTTQAQHPCRPQRHIVHICTICIWGLIYMHLRNPTLAKLKLCPACSSRIGWTRHKFSTFNYFSFARTNSTSRSPTSRGSSQNLAQFLLQASSATNYDQKLSFSDFRFSWSASKRRQTIWYAAFMVALYELLFFASNMVIHSPSSCPIAPGSSIAPDYSIAPDSQWNCNNALVQVEVCTRKCLHQEVSTRLPMKW